MSDIFREVEEDVRREKAEKFWKAYGGYVMAAGVIAYGVSVTMNIWLFDRLRGAAGSSGAGAAVRGFIAAALSQIVDTLIFITVSFYGEREIGSLLLGQMLAKVTLSLVLVPPLIALFVALARRLDRAPA